MINPTSNKNPNEPIIENDINRFFKNFTNPRLGLATMPQIKLSDSWISENTPDAPIVKIGSTWRLTSPLDSWTNLARFMSEHDFQLLHESFIQIVSEKDPALELPEGKKYMASFYGKTSQYSKLSKKPVLFDWKVAHS